MPSLGALLREHKIGSPHDGATDPVFATATGRPMYYRNVTRRGLRAAMVKAGIVREGEPPIRFHDLRHTYASLLIAQGLNVVFISRQLGHAAASMTLDVYGGQFDRAEHAQRAAEGLEEAFSATLRPEVLSPAEAIHPTACSEKAEETLTDALLPQKETHPSAGVRFRRA
jgi:integrase